MLDSLLGRSSFYSKCKSLIKQTRTRIEVVRRKLNAKQKFFRKDIADLLVNRLDSNAFGRTDALIAELILSSCYDFIDHVCEIVLKHLPVLDKLRDCPEDCREAVASLMFAAARLSDLPELRDLRNLFQERYGSSLEFYVNQKLVDNITVKPPSVEKKIELLQDIALEFSIRWDSKKFLETMSSSDTAQKARNSPGSLHLAKNKIATPPAVVTVQKAVKNEPLTRNLHDATYHNMEREIGSRHQRVTQSNNAQGKIDDLKHNVYKSPNFTGDKNKLPSYREETTQKLDHEMSFQRKEHKACVGELIKDTSVEDDVQIVNLSHGRRQHHVPERDLPNTLSRQKPDTRPTTDAINFSSPVDNGIAEDVHIKPVRKQLGDATDVSKSSFRGGIPPPYVKPRKNKHKTDDENDTLTFKPADNLQTKTDSPRLKDGASSSENGDVPPLFTEIYYKDGLDDATARRGSHRRKHSRSSSIQVDDVNGEERVIRRVSTSRRKNEPKSGLKVVLGDDRGHYKKDEEEIMIDKLLLHYSKKPSSTDPGKLRRKTSSSKSPHRRSSARNEINVDEDLRLAKSKSFSVPPRQDTEPKIEKVFTRAASFDQETPVKHVHPKLPNYDDLAAAFAAMRAAKGK